MNHQYIQPRVSFLNANPSIEMNKNQKISKNTTQTSPAKLNALVGLVPDPTATVKELPVLHSRCDQIPHWISFTVPYFSLSYSAQRLICRRTNPLQLNLPCRPSLKGEASYFCSHHYQTRLLLQRSIRLGSTSYSTVKT